MANTGLLGLWNGGYNANSLGFQGQQGAKPGLGQITFNPTPYTNRFLPTFTPGDPGSMAAAQAGNSMGGGWQRRGIQAFLPGDLNFADMDWSPVTNQYGDAGPQVTPDYNKSLNSFKNQVGALAQQLGYDVSGYNPSELGRLGMGASNNAAWNQPWIKASPASRQAGGGNFQDLVKDINKDLSSFVRLRGPSAGYDGKGNARSTSEALYYVQPDGTYIPVSAPKSGVKREHRGWAKEEGAETLAGLSMIMPAFGGWAGILGNGVGGTLTAGGGLGLTGGLGAVGNMAANVIGNSLMTGNSPTLASMFGAVAPGAIGGLLKGNGLSNLFGNAAAVSGAPSYNNLGQLMNSGIGQAIRGTLPYRATGPGANLGMRGINSLARLFS